MAKKYNRQRGQRPTEKPNRSGKRKAVKRSEKQKVKKIILYERNSKSQEETGP